VAIVWKYTQELKEMQGVTATGSEAAEVAESDLELGRSNIAKDLHFTHLAREHETGVSLPEGESLDGAVGDAFKRIPATKTSVDGDESLEVILGEARPLDRDAPLGEDAKKNRLTVAKTVARERLESMPDGMPDVEHDTPARWEKFALILRHEGGLNAKTSCRHFQHGIRTDREQIIEVLFDEVEERGISNQRVLQGFSETGNHFAPGQRRKKVDIRQDEAGLVVRPDRVLSERMVDAVLPPDRTVDLGKECGRDLNKRDAAPVRGGDISTNISHHAAAERNQRGGPREGLPEERGVQGTRPRWILLLFAWWHHQRRNCETFRAKGGNGSLQRRGCAVAVREHDDAIRDCMTPTRGAERIQDPRSKVDRITVFAKLNR
jgi:hypothetical protein